MEKKPSSPIPAHSRIVSCASIPIRLRRYGFGVNPSMVQAISRAPSLRSKCPKRLCLAARKKSLQEDSFFGDRICLEKVSGVLNRTTPSNRPYLYLERNAFLAVNEAFPAYGIACSPIVGDPDTWAAFHCFDPDGNQINVSACRYD